jgi:hypothetical protein
MWVPQQGSSLGLGGRRERLGWEAVWSGTSEQISMTKQAMTEYEIRILGSDGRPSLFSEWIHVSLNAAVRSAKRMANGATLKYG